MRNLLKGILAVVTTASLASAVPIRVDYNGELVSGGILMPAQVSIYPGDRPIGWEYYSEGAGGNIGATYNTGSSSKAGCLSYENEDALRPGATYPGGHSVILGGAAGVGRYGISQSITSTAGKHYYMVGAQKWSSNPTSAYSQWGLGNGDTRFSPTGGMEGNGNYGLSSLDLGKQGFVHGTIATGSQITAHVGVRGTALANLNNYVDGIRVVESNVNVYSSFNNGSFEGDAWNVSNWATKATPSGSGVNDQYMVDGWLPLGGSAGSYSQTVLTDSYSGFGKALLIDGYKSAGRNYLFQRIDDGLPPHEWTLGGMVKSYSVGDSDARIGIDPTGGLDPTSPSIVWSAASSANMAWEYREVTAMGGGANGVTVWLASGYDPVTHGGGNRSSGTVAGAFDDIGIPEPTTMLLWAVAGIFCLRRR